MTLMPAQRLEAVAPIGTKAACASGRTPIWRSSIRRQSPTARSSAESGEVLSGVPTRSSCGVPVVSNGQLQTRHAGTRLRGQSRTDVTS